MTFITTNYKENSNNDFKALPEGTYEMLVQSVQEVVNDNGKEKLQIRLLVRNDLDGVPELAETNAKYHNRIVFMDNWKRKATNKYDKDSIQNILEALGIPEGVPYNTLEDFSKGIVGKPASVFVKNEEDNYNGNNKRRNTVAPWNFKKTKFPQVSHKFKDGDLGLDPFTNSQTVDISDSDLPF